MQQHDSLLCCQASSGSVQTVHETEDLHMTNKYKPQIVVVAKIVFILRMQFDLCT